MLYGYFEHKRSTHKYVNIKEIIHVIYHCLLNATLEQQYTFVQCSWHTTNSLTLVTEHPS